MQRAAAGAVPVAAAAAAAQRLVADLGPMLGKVEELNNGKEALAGLVPFTVDGSVLGRMRPEFAQQLAAQGGAFRLEGGRISLDPSLQTEQQRTAAVAGVMQRMRDAGQIKGWRGELYPLGPAFDAPPLLLIERAAAPYFGMRSYGVHVNGYVVDADGSKRLWVARRSRDKQTWPGKLDHIVAGGQPFGISCRDNVIKECAEEASIPEELAAQAVATGFISYVSILPEGLKPDVLFIYDLQLPADFVPKPQDGEVEEFMLWDLVKVADVIAHTDDYKPNCGVVVMDFLVRHGYITPDQPGYTRLVAGFREGGPC